MTTDEEPRARLARAGRRYRGIPKIRDELEAAIVAARLAGVPPGEVARILDGAVTDRRIRQICEAHDIPPGEPGRKPKR